MGLERHNSDKIMFCLDVHTSTLFTVIALLSFSLQCILHLNGE